MRGDEFATMMRRAHAHSEQLDAILSEGERQKPDAMLAKPGNRMDGTRYVQVRDGVAVIDLNGVIAKRMNLFEEMCFGGASTEILLRDFHAAIDSPNVESVVLNIDSPGGEAFGINELAQAIYDARGKKPIKAYISGLGCSGAYWIATAAEEIIIDKSAFVGSIGVVTAWMDDKEFYQMMGIRREVVTSSNAPFKRLDFDNEEHRAELQKELDSLESVFIKAVARNRKVTVDQVKKDFNQGGVLAGADAVKAGMADRTGSLEDVIRGLRSKRSKAAGANAAVQGDFDMGFKDEFKAFAQKLGLNVTDAEVSTEADEATKPADEETKPTPAPEPAKEPVKEPAKDEADEKPVDEGNEVEAVRAELFQTQANAFVEAEMKEGRLFPAEKAAFASLFVQAALDDHRTPLAEGSRLDAIKAIQTARPAHGLTQETVSGADNELFILGLGNSEKTQLDKDVDAQVSQYVGTVTPLKAVK